MLKQIYTHLRSPFGLVAMAIVTVGAISATQHVPIKAQVSTETTCPVGKECCWHINNNECEREIYESTPFDNYKEYCELKAGQGKSVFETYEACAQGESTCRNGKKEVDPGEECDDDNNINDDECTNECQNAANMDNIIQSHLNEECDDGNPVNNDACTNEGKKARCGDGVTQPYRGETCDKGSGNDVVDENGEYCSSVSCTTVRVAQDDDEDEDENEDDDKDQGSNSSASSRKSQSSASSVKTVTTPAQPEQKPVNTTNSNTVLPSVPSVPEESAETAEAKKKAEEEKKKAEEERLEEQQKILEDILERSLEDAKEKDVENDDTVLEDNPDTTTVETKTEPVVVKQQNVIKEDDLRCTDADGNLTTDRSKCDYVKEQEIRKPVTITIPEPEIEKKIRENVLGSDIVQKRSDSLLVTLRDLRARTENIANSEEFNTEVEQYLQDVLDWLDRGTDLCVDQTAKEPAASNTGHQPDSYADRGSSCQVP